MLPAPSAITWADRSWKPSAAIVHGGATNRYMLQQNKSNAWWLHAISKFNLQSYRNYHSYGQIANILTVPPTGCWYHLVTWLHLASATWVKIFLILYSTPEAERHREAEHHNATRKTDPFNQKSSYKIATKDEWDWMHAKNINGKKDQCSQALEQ